MATKSILKTVHIKDRRSARRLANALENSQVKPSKEVRMGVKVTNASKKEIRDIFGKT
jgi:hypothetical protein